MKKNRMLLLFFLFFNQIYGQKLVILSDSVFVDSSYFRINELKIDFKNGMVKDIYKVFQTSSKVFDKPFVGLPEERLKAKIDTLKFYVSEKALETNKYSFENYEIYLEERDIVNFSINTTHYQSPWEDWDYFLIDLISGKKIESDLFINPNRVLKKCKSKIKREGFNCKISLRDLRSFKFNMNENNDVIGLDIIFFDYNHYRNSGYEMIIVPFELNELKKNIYPALFDKILHKN